MVLASRGQYSRSRGQDRHREKALAGGREKSAAADSHATPYPNYVRTQWQSPHRRSPATYVSSARLRKSRKARRRHVSPVPSYASGRPESIAAAVSGRGYRQKGGRRGQRGHSLRRGVVDGQRQRSALPAVQGSVPIRARTVYRQKQIHQSWRTRGDRTTHVADGQRRLSRLDTRRRQSLVLLPSASGYENENRHIQNVAR